MRKTPYRHHKRNTVNHLGNRRLNPNYEGIDPTHKMYHPPVRENKRFRGEDGELPPMKSHVVAI